MSFRNAGDSSQKVRSDERLATRHDDLHQSHPANLLPRADMQHSHHSHDSLRHRFFALGGAPVNFPIELSHPPYLIRTTSPLPYSHTIVTLALSQIVPRNLRLGTTHIKGLQEAGFAPISSHHFSNLSNDNRRQPRITPSLLRRLHRRVRHLSLHPHITNEKWHSVVQPCASAKQVYASSSSSPPFSY